jgi:hypothetical protein
MIPEQDLKSIEFCKEQYLFEYERSKFYDTIIQFPSTLLIIFIGGVLFSFNKYFVCGLPDSIITLDWVFIISLGLFSVSTIFTIYFLYIVFHGFTRRYYYLPYLSLLAKHGYMLFKYHYRYSKKGSKDEKLIEARSNTCKSISDDLMTYYIELTDANQKINDKRADNYYLTRTFLFFDLILFVIIALIGFLK